MGHASFLVSVVSAAWCLLLAVGSPSFAQQTKNDAVVPFVLPQSGPFRPEEITVDNQKAISDWYRSAHADQAAEAFSRWDSDEGIGPACAVCHSGEGFRGYHGLDGSEPGIPQNPYPPAELLTAAPATTKDYATSKRFYSQAVSGIRLSVQRRRA